MCLFRALAKLPVDTLSELMLLVIVELPISTGKG